ncbi:MAG: YggS family pyridoxal phosphate-dependent enzyme [Myxococcota bacterium]
MTDVSERFARVEEDIRMACQASGRRRSEIKVVAVSKRQPEARLRDAIELGHRDFGENYPQELAEKQARFPELSWHQVGHVQRNKAKLLDRAVLVHSLDSLRLARTLSDLGQKTRPVPVLLQVNQAREEQKTGWLEEELDGLFEALPDLGGIDVMGFMTLPPPGEGRRYFAELRALRERWRDRSGLPLAELSMGMSDDFEAAIHEGATLLRIGTALFGPRPEN